MDALRRGDKANAMAKHYLISHPTTIRDLSTQLFKVEIVDTNSSNLERYIAEGLAIEDTVKDAKVPQLNSKGEWGRVSTRRLTVVDRVPNWWKLRLTTGGKTGNKVILMESIVLFDWFEHRYDLI